MNKIERSTSKIIAAASLQLAKFIRSALKKNMEVKRITICSIALYNAGTFSKGNLFTRVAKYIINHQQNDGGWSDVEETLLSIKTLSFMSNYSSSMEKGNRWLLSQRNPDGGWGRSNRDISRIPTTGFILHLLPSFSDQRAVNWLKKEWAIDFERSTRLTYKGGFFLLGLSSAKVTTEECPLIKDTYFFFTNEQNKDGGFGPWKHHPIGSDPWSTGVVLLGLLSYPDLVNRVVIERAVNWLSVNQLPNGFWPYHYIEEGSAYAYWGLVEALKYL